MIKSLTRSDVDAIIKTSPPGKNTKFLNASHSLWIRFNNYEKNAPIGYFLNEDAVSVAFAGFNRNGYANLYDIVTLEGRERKGYATALWDRWIHYAINERNSKNLKISCTPESVTWHLRNGLVFWAVDPSGSLRSDQPLFPTREEQLVYQKWAIENGTEAARNLLQKTQQQFMNEGLDGRGFGVKKTLKIQQAIDSVGKCWMRDFL